ncbi:site-specific DNA-methyltransferase [Paracoccus litorisediminis]|uniref:DNA-methyltransferase n=1 Tax=Paracoccus litorisediminis TaxID=2006130 RepID=UPI00372F1E8D
MRDVTIGSCRIILGDAMALLCRLDEKADLIVTDPPYRLTSGGRNGQVMSGKFARDRYDNSGDLMDIVSWDEMALPLYHACKPDADLYVMANNKQIFPAHAALSRAGWRDHNLLAWNKGSPTRNRWYMKDLEYTLYLYKGRAKTIRQPGSKQLFSAARPDCDWHPTAKPVALFEHYISNSSDPGDLVIDPFGGSGTCAIAALKTGRRCISYEINPEWFERKVARIRKAHDAMPPAV